MAVKIKLARFGKIREPFYRVVVADARTRRGGRAIEAIGKYHPKADPSVIEIDSERAQYWLGVGAQPTESVLGLLKVTGDWQRFKGLPGAEGTLRPQPERVDKRARYEAALAAVGADTSASATTPRRRAGRTEGAGDAAAAAPADDTAADQQ
ncbi:30S ribosomal protein S16 [Nakamurella endophytica]|uniref:30S ribosomal protein S16 n=1 Tax=Nakamurella endophytica TaxID=1748367 RepID=UPI001663F664|nr:30S ribosomal protein S16 [Nakamurella endophytica]